MVTKIVVHFGGGGRDTVTIHPNKGVRGVLFNDGKLTVPKVAKSDKREKLDGRVEAKVDGKALKLSQIEERLGVCYWVDDGSTEELICW